MLEKRASSQAGLVLFQGLTPRRRAARRRSAALTAIIVVLAAGWLAGALMTPSGAADPVRLGPFSYFPSQ